MDESDDHGGEPPCFEHLIAGGESVDPQIARDVARFRKAERVRLLAGREMAVEDRKICTDKLIGGLDSIVAPGPGMRIAAYWPIRGEPDLRRWMVSAHERGAQILLPIVVRKNQPLEFHEWTPGCKVARGVWNILVPTSGTKLVPDTVIAPLVGVDKACFRLGNGGGYYDRTLAAMQPHPRTIGIGFAGCRLKTIFPMPWDVPMDEVLLSDRTRLSHQAHNYAAASPRTTT
jgi:5,10-methenyltetrahydrofolate synthetase